MSLFDILRTLTSEQVKEVYMCLNSVKNKFSYKNIRFDTHRTKN
jgi:hypothetical protein